MLRVNLSYWSIPIFRTGITDYVFLIRKEQKFKLKKSLSAISGEKISQRENIKITFIFLIIEKFENN